MRKLIVFLILLSLVGGPASAKDTGVVDQKYCFSKLETVERFTNWSIDGWNVIDQQSLIVYTSPSRSYLIILDRRLPELRFAETVAVSSTVSSIDARFDTVRVLDRYGINFPVRIARIYRLEGREQRRLVRDQILNKSAQSKNL